MTRQLDWDDDRQPVDTDLTWGAILTALGGFILITAPVQQQGWFLLIGGIGSAVGLFFICRYALKRMGDDR